ncbi:Cortactin-binding protein 2 [Xenoophorus captivus]|uniref:Cortactin-binding protein 2 n=1 Tax=Xenoophorus captivus TaxID=1517983 RepID=A0ABV0RU58_9TELE
MVMGLVSVQLLQSSHSNSGVRMATGLAAVMDECWVAQRKEVFLQDRYGHYTLTDPFLALQRDFECRAPGGDKERRPLGSSPISVLEAVMAHCRKMQERMSAQLAAAESRQKRVRNPFISG